MLTVRVARVAAVRGTRCNTDALGRLLFGVSMAVAALVLVARPDGEAPPFRAGAPPVAAAARDLAERSRACGRDPAVVDEPASVVSAVWVASGDAGSAEATAVATVDPAPTTTPATATPRHICLTDFILISPFPVASRPVRLVCGHCRGQPGDFGPSSAITRCNSRMCGAVLVNWTSAIRRHFGDTDTPWPQQHSWVG